MKNPAFKGIAQLSLTYECQCNCEHCGVKYFKNAVPNKMTLGFIKKIFRDLELCGCEHVDLSGGEPTLRSDIFEIIQIGKSHGLDIMLETNGLSLDENRLKKMKKCGIGRISLSIDHFDEKEHDDARRRKGAFASAVKALNTASRLGINVHISTVPPNREYFINGGMNRQIGFCLENGAEKVRILFPSYVGNCSLKNKVFCSEKDELSLLRHISPEFYDSVYVESELGDLRSIIDGKDPECPAKSIFCYIACNGLVMPCPYLPIAFGDLSKESLIEIWHRMKSHPFLKNSGVYCPTRDKDYINTVLKDISPQQPFKIIKCENKINFRSECNNNCIGCSMEPAQETMDALLKKISKIDKKYGAIDLFGGEIFTRKDIFDILGKIPPSFCLNIYTNGRIFSYPSSVSKLRQYNINSLKIVVFSLNKDRFDKVTRVPGSFEQTMRGIENLAKASIPVCVYLPNSEIRCNLDPLISNGVSSISSYEKTDTSSSTNSLLCFGEHVCKTTLLWNRHG